MKAILKSIFFMSLVSICQAQDYTIESTGVMVNASSVVSGDFNKDGITDIVFSNSDNNTIHWYNYSTAISVVTEVVLPGVVINSNLLTDDYDGDGKLDLMVINGNRLEIAKNTTTGSTLKFTLQSANANTTFAGTHTMIAADVDEDGRKDIVLLKSSEKKITILYQGPDSKYKVEQVGILTKDINRMRVADFDPSHPGKEIITCSLASDASVVYHYKAGASWQKVTAIQDAEAYDVDVADLTGDGLSDVVLANLKKSSLELYTNMGGTVPSYTKKILKTETGFNTYVVTVNVLDLYNDGKLDIISGLNVNNDNKKGSFWVNDGSGTFEERPAPPVWYANHLYPADVDNDGDQDWLYSAPVGIWYIKNNAPPSATAAPELSIDLAVYPNPSRDRVTISSAHTIGELALYTLDGRQLYSKQAIDATSYALDVSSMVTGVYRVILGH